MIYNRVVDFKKLIQHQLKLQLYWFHCSIRTFRMAFHLQLIIFQLPDLRTMNNFMQILTLSLFFLSRTCDRNKFIWMLVVCEKEIIECVSASVFGTLSEFLRLIQCCDSIKRKWFELDWIGFDSYCLRFDFFDRGWFFFFYLDLDLALHTEFESEQKSKLESAIEWNFGQNGKIFDWNEYIRK